MRDGFFEELSEKLNETIGKLSIVAMMGGQQHLVKECHQQLIDLSNWIDDEINADEEASK